MDGVVRKAFPNISFSYWILDTITKQKKYIGKKGTFLQRVNPTTFSFEKYLNVSLHFSKGYM